MRYLVISFLLVFAMVLAGVAFNMLIGRVRHQTVAKNMLLTVAGERPMPVKKILKDAVVPEVSKLYAAMAKVNLARHVDDLIRSSGLTWTPLVLVGATAVALIPGLLLGLTFPLIINAPVTCVTLGGAFATVPYLYVRTCSRKRMAELEEQFPDALDFLARSVRAGHSFSISLSMVSENVPEPLAVELNALFNEINLGASLETALKNFTTRIPLLDFRFFTSAVLLQRQTGGNICEIFTRLAYVIRERFKLKGQVKAVSAHGRLTAAILTLMPIGTALLLSVVAPGYLSGMAKDTDGRYLLVAAASAVLIGNYIIRRIIAIKV
jgi:tight adherence protein B